LVAIGGCHVNDYWWIFYCGYWWLLMTMMLMVIGEFSIGGYW
jgi:hypothetical protein